MAERVVRKHPPCSKPSWVSNETIKLKEDRAKAKRVFLQSQTTRTKVAWRILNSSLNLSFERDRTEALHRQIDELFTAEEKGDYSTTWKVVRDISGKNQKVRAKVKKRNGAPPSSDKEILSEWKDYFISLLKNIRNSAKELPPLAEQDLSMNPH